MEKYICIHGHFYQPPRENPWLEEIERQPSAFPFDNWNQRIASECYAMNAFSRILNNKKKIINILNNYCRISFNFGPTLLSWMERHDPETYQEILKADEASQKNFSGHGSAMAQVYNHIIMPLANREDKRTQIIWGIKDFEHRFKRKPEGMWLAETAADLETLSLMADEGIKFTILAPHQAKRVRRIDETDWTDVSGQRVDPKRPYLCRLPSKKTIAIFFYDGPVSRAVAFEGLLKSGADFANRLLSLFDPSLDTPQLVNIATDGETYGHHHRFADMALAFCLDYIETKKLARITNYGEFLEKFPPQDEVEIFESTSWSCAHGVERWKDDCGCRIGANPRWNQKWRKPLREALTWLRDKSQAVYELQMSDHTKDVWHLRNAYIEVILDRNPQTIETFLSRQNLTLRSHDDGVKVLKLLELQRNALLMFTSCAWFFDEISGIEAVQIMKYAARVIQLLRELSGDDLEPDFLNILEAAKSNIPEYEDGKFIYVSQVKPCVVDLLRAGAHFAVSSLFEEFSEESKVYSYTVKSEIQKKKEVDRLKLSIGKGWVRSDITLEKKDIYFVSLHLGNHNVIRGTEELLTGVYPQAESEIIEAFMAKRIPEAIRHIDKYFGPQNYSIQCLFQNEQQKILDEVLKTTMQEIETSFRQIYDRHHPLMQVQREFQVSLPKALSTIVEFVLNKDLCDEIQKTPMDMKRIRMLVWELKRWSFSRYKETIGVAAKKRVSELMHDLARSPDDIDLMESIASLLENFSHLNFDIEIWSAQNILFALRNRYLADKKRKAEKKDAISQRWLYAFRLLGEFLSVEVDDK